MKKRNSKKGFTLVELVIVIAVIAILASVLIPTFGGIIDKANQSAALQEAKNEYTAYLTTVDYSQGYTQIADGYVKVSKSGKDYYVVITNGNISTTASESAPDGTYTQVNTLKAGAETTDTTDDKKFEVYVK